MFLLMSSSIFITILCIIFFFCNVRDPGISFACPMGEGVFWKVPALALCYATSAQYPDAGTNMVRVG